MSRTLAATLSAAAILAATMAGMAPHPVVPGMPTMGALPACTRYESALLATSANHGHVVRLACLPGEPV